MTPKPNSLKHKIISAIASGVLAGVTAIFGVAHIPLEWVFLGTVILWILGYCLAEALVGPREHQVRSLWTSLGLMAALILGVLVYVEFADTSQTAAKNPSIAHPTAEILSPPAPDLPGKPGDSVTFTGRAANLPRRSVLWFVVHTEGQDYYATHRIEVAPNGEWASSDNQFGTSKDPPGSLKYDILLVLARDAETDHLLFRSLYEEGFFVPESLIREHVLFRKSYIA